MKPNEKIPKKSNLNLISIYDEINHTNFKKIRDQLSGLIAEGAPDIIVSISSFGGYAVPGLKIYDLLDLYPGKVTGIVIGEANSMAGIILQACNLRLASRHSKFQLHLIRLNEIPCDHFHHKDKIKEHLAESKEYLKETLDIFKKRTHLSRNEIKKHLIKDLVIRAQEAKTLGFIDGILAKDDVRRLLNAH